MRVKFLNFQSAQSQNFFPLMCSSSGIYVLPKQIKLRDKIKDYCNSYSFVTYESKPALELVVYDIRDRVWL